ncbi:ATP-binding protein, partial [uncultured Bacteroides sp.]
RVELVSPGAMLDGTQIQDRDIYKVPSMRRNPVIADVFTQLDYMEKRGSGLRKMRELTEKLPNFLQGKEPQYQTEATSFYTTFYNLNWSENGRIPVEEVAERINSSVKKFGVSDKSSVKGSEIMQKGSEKTFGERKKTSVRIFGDREKTSVTKGNSSVKSKRLGRTAQSIIDLVIADALITEEKMAERIGVSKRAIEMQIANLRAKGILIREGADFGGYWRILTNPQTKQ